MPESLDLAKRAEAYIIAGNYVELAPLLDTDIVVKFYTNTFQANFEVGFHDGEDTTMLVVHRTVLQEILNYLDAIR